MHIYIPPQVDLGVDPNKLTGVDLDNQSQVGSFMHGVDDPPSNLNQQSDFTSVVIKST